MEYDRAVKNFVCAVRLHAGITVIVTISRFVRTHDGSKGKDQQGMGVQRYQKQGVDRVRRSVSERELHLRRPMSLFQAA
jgi:hypothetical protein